MNRRMSVVPFFQKLLAPRILSTVEEELNLPPSLSELNETAGQTGTPGNNRNSKVYKVAISELVQRLRKVEELFSTDRVFCAFEMPEGETKLVLRRRMFGQGYHELLHCSELRHFNDLLRTTDTLEHVYILCCEGFRKAQIIDMLLTVADDLRNRQYSEDVTLAYPLSAKEVLDPYFSETIWRFHEKRMEYIYLVYTNISDILQIISKAREDGVEPDHVVNEWKPPLATFHGNKICKILWHREGRIVIKREYKLWFTGTGVKVRRHSFIMWSAIFVGVVLTIAYVVARQDSTDIEDLVQTALAIAALYAASVIPIAYYMFYEGENMFDVVTGKAHLDTRKECKELSDEERLYICLQSLHLPESDRMFIDKYNTSYVTGSIAGAAMRVNYLPCIGNLLAVGFKYWEDKDGSSVRKGLISPSRNVFELADHNGKDGDKVKRLTKPTGNNSVNPLDIENSILRLCDLTEMKDCPIEHFYVGL